MGMGWDGMGRDGMGWVYSSLYVCFSEYPIMMNLIKEECPLKLVPVVV